MMFFIIFFCIFILINEYENYIYTDKSDIHLPGSICHRISHILNSHHFMHFSCVLFFISFYVLYIFLFPRNNANNDADPHIMEERACAIISVDNRLCQSGISVELVRISWSPRAAMVTSRQLALHDGAFFSPPNKSNKK